MIVIKANLPNAVVGTIHNASAVTVPIFSSSCARGYGSIVGSLLNIRVRVF
jgi:hypothetical protein